MAHLRNGAIPVEHCDLWFLRIDPDRKTDPSVGRVDELNRIPRGIRYEGGSTLIIARAHKKLKEVISKQYNLYKLGGLQKG